MGSIYNDTPIREMANISPQKSGISHAIYVSSEEGGHGPRIKVYEGSRAGSGLETSIWQINQDPNELPQWLDGFEITDGQLRWAIQAWIDLNRRVLLRMWYDGDSMMFDEWQSSVQSLKAVDKQAVMLYKERFKQE